MNYVLGWSPLVMPRYRMVDDDIAEIAALEADVPGIKVNLCHFHRQQSWSR